MDERCAHVVVALITSLFCENFRSFIVYEWLRFSSKADQGCIASFVHLLESILTSKISFCIRPHHVEIFKDNSTLRIPKTIMTTDQCNLLKIIELSWPRFFERKIQSFDPGADSLEDFYYDTVVDSMVDRRLLFMEILMKTINEGIRLWEGNAFTDVYEIIYASLKNLFAKDCVHPMTDETRDRCVFLLRTIKTFKKGSAILHNKMVQDRTKRLEASAMPQEQTEII